VEESGEGEMGEILLRSRDGSVWMWRSWRNWRELYAGGTDMDAERLEDDEKNGARGSLKDGVGCADGVAWVIVTNQERIRLSVENKAFCVTPYKW
jgi:hypothetical protein